MKTSLRNHQLLLNNHHNKGKSIFKQAHNSYNREILIDSSSVKGMMFEWIITDRQTLNRVTFTTEKSIKCGNNLVNKKVIRSKTLFRLYPKWVHGVVDVIILIRADQSRLKRTQTWVMSTSEEIIPVISPENWFQTRTDAGTRELCHYPHYFTRILLVTHHHTHITQCQYLMISVIRW